MAGGTPGEVSATGLLKGSRMLVSTDVSCCTALLVVWMMTRNLRAIWRTPCQGVPDFPSWQRGAWGPFLLTAPDCEHILLPTIRTMESPGRARGEPGWANVLRLEPPGTEDWSACDSHECDRQHSEGSGSRLSPAGVQGGGGEGAGERAPCG